MKPKSIKAHRIMIRHLPIRGFEYDPEAKAIYLAVADGEVDHTKRISDSLFVDVDKRGRTLGIEILRVKQFQGQLIRVIEEIAKAYPIRELLQTA